MSLSKRILIFTGLVLVIIMSVRGIIATDKNKKVMLGSGVTLTEIDPEIIEMVVADVNELEMVNDTAIIIKEDKITLSVVVDSGTTKDTAKEIGEGFTKLLSDSVATNSDLIGTQGSGYGGLFEEYNLEVLVGTDSENIIAHGVKLKVGKTIKW